MAKLSLIQRVITPTKSTGAKKGLLKQDGITSSDAVSHDDDSSSLSHRKELARGKGKKKFDAPKFLFFRKRGVKSGDDEEGYESDTSTGSTRSTSSSFLRYQNRAAWKSKLTTKKAVRQRREDGLEAPVKDETRPWPMFDKIYKRQNQVKKKGILGMGDADDDDDDDDDSDSSDGTCPLAPPAPTISISNTEEEECVGEMESGSPDPSECQSEPQENGVISVIKTLVVGRSSGDEVKSTLDKGSEQSPKSVDGIDNQLTKESDEVEPQRNRPIENEPASWQESGIPTSETPKAAPTSPPPAPKTHLSSPSEPSNQNAPQSPPAFPTQKLSQSTPESTSSNKKSSPGDLKKHSANGKSIRKKKYTSFEEVDIVPTSIPPTICYSLRSAIGDGSARQRTSHSLMERRPLRPNGSSVETSYWSHRGKRNYMEDRYCIEHVGSTHKSEEDSERITFMAVFDGHGGSAASQFCSDWMSSYLRKKNEHFPENLPLALKSAFVKADADFVGSGAFDGTTACACAVVGNKVVCCNAGDSRAIIVRKDGSAFALSEDHKPDRNDETKRINDLGGRVIHWGRWRVEGVLAVSRSIGDAKLKPYVTAEPDVVEYEIGEDDMFLVLASDGVWDTMSSDLVAKFVLVNTCRIVDKELQVDEKLLRWIARQVSKRARENGSSDNISCIVANLRGKCS